nr:hypothetical protein [Burkholderiales bacterium]
EVFWAPLYFPAGGHRLSLRGTLAGESIRVEEGTLKLKGVGESRLTALWNLGSGLSAINADASALDAGGLYTLLLKPLLEKTALEQLAVSGKVDAAIRYGNNAIQQFDLRLANVSLSDVRGRFALDKLNAAIPWHTERETRADIKAAGAKLLGVPIGALEVPVKMRGFDFDVDDVAVPFLDGQLLIKDLHAVREKQDWRWQFSGVLLPVSMEALTKALDLPMMRGNLAATIPTVAYEKGSIGIEGGIGIRVFDGDVAITKMSLAEPFGRAPRLNADVEMRSLDLQLLTSTFKFGSIEGRIDADINGLQLSNWRPVAFDARIESSAGNYRKKISQQAVQNISALGGAGAAAAIQRSFLSFFEEFGYEKIGLSCRLRNTVCEMSGIESTPGGYIIVKGGGIPAITVKGYNREVGWNELLERLSRITQGNVQPVIK